MGTWGIHKKRRDFYGGGFLDVLRNIGGVVGSIAKPVLGVVSGIGGAIGNAIKPGAGDDFRRGVGIVQNALGGGYPGGGYPGGGAECSPIAPAQNYGSTLRHNKMIPRLDSDSDETD